MEVSSRPDSVRQLFEDFYKAIDDENWERAEEVLLILERKIGNNDPEVNSCRVRLELEQM